MIWNHETSITSVFATEMATWPSMTKRKLLKSTGGSRSKLNISEQRLLWLLTTFSNPTSNYVDHYGRAVPHWWMPVLTEDEHRLCGPPTKRVFLCPC